MQQFRTSPREMAASLWRNRQLILASTKREVMGPYRGSVIGLAWSFFNPVLMLVVYTFVFSVVFKAPAKLTPRARAVTLPEKPVSVI